MKNKDYEKCIKLLNFLDIKFISHIKKELIHQLVKELSFDKIERINSYWNSDIFIKYRNSLIVNKYEDIKEEKKDNK